MERDINDKILLVGEANFSFTLSLIKYCEARFITTSCYESKDECVKKYGAELVENNVHELRESGVADCLFGVDACRLGDYFNETKFSRIIFMFPHVSGRSNLKKNRALVDAFFQSARQHIYNYQFDLFNDTTLNTNRSFIYITLAKGTQL